MVDGARFGGLCPEVFGGLESFQKMKKRKRIDHLVFKK
jgi:hypothetical protein